MGVATNDLDLNIVYIFIIFVMLKFFQGFHHDFCGIFKFAFNYVKAYYFYMDRMSYHICETVPKGIPIATVITGEIKCLTNRKMYFQIMSYIGEIDCIHFSVLIHKSFLMKLIALLGKKVVIYLYTIKLRPFFLRRRRFVNVIYVCASQRK